MTVLVREQIKNAFDQSTSINPSLLLQTGLLEIPNGDDGSGTEKTNHLKKMADLSTSDLYKNAFNRWYDLTSDTNRFQQSVMQLENRLLIGLTGNGALETGCSLHHSYGMPYISGSGVKGVVRAWAKKHLPNSQDALEELFGSYDSDQQNRVSGTVTFHDAWWIPKENSKPFVLDVVTTHHQAYYNGSQDSPSDKDSPTPNHLLAVQGSFLFVVEGHPESVKLCHEMLEKALTENGIGAKTAAGYGYMKADLELTGVLQTEAEKRLPPEIREKRKAEAQRRVEQAREAAAKAEREMPPSRVIEALNSHYQKKRDNADYQAKVESWIDAALDSWTAQDRSLLATCLNKVGYIPKKKKQNYQIRKDRLQALKAVNNDQ